MPTTRPIPAYIIAAAQRLADSAPDLDEQALVMAFTAIGASAPEPRTHAAVRAA